MPCKYSTADGNCELDKLTHMEGYDKIEINNHEIKINGVAVQRVKEINIKVNSQKPHHPLDITMTFEADAVLNLVKETNSN